MERVRAVAGVESAAEAFIVPMSGSGWNQKLVIGGSKQDGIVNFNRVGVDYFRTMDTPLARRPDVRRHRSARRAGDRHRERVVRAQVLRRRRPDREGLPDRRSRRDEPSPHYQIVGVVKDTKYTDLREDFTPIAYFAAPAGNGGRAVPRSDRPIRSAGGSR